MERKNFTVIDNWILESEDLNIEEKYFLIALKKFDHRNCGEVFPSYKSLMMICSTKRKAKISKLIKALVEKGYIEKKIIKRVNHYYFKKDF
ncbi:helix-turn-helix domain-containing protein [Clostridium septicum]|uniref:Helix-turn-helix domain-containing protein n=1 Tax=Clostridium septicum TaxID=1504 RepID=A0A9N7PKS8_CLOSE|nr:helix-turn-helix domain-containing protein [Clostridium septicum]AYE33841.1 helix-turn-helix domain-containing protein [Clostridium septicum]MDU1314741.1 helix-turn-helix domain-containing protein [Clostridium septicum]QAS61987.1 helix-turn-helix domain-containing protein [Clostridium septicum]UEC21548.1 helix-turn-helix domain-containing protein [Clostridium septicum]USS00406.1 helix-turn-helix domain-containing protein [Clostridium septicum]